MELYKRCTISWLSLSIEPLQVVGIMRMRFSPFLSGALMVVAMLAVPARAEDKIQAITNSYGKVVFTNVADNPPIIESVPAVDSIVEPPRSLVQLIDTISTNHGVDPALVRALIKTESNFN